MTLTDAGPIVALLNHTEQSHALCREVASQLAYGPMLTTWVCFTEAMYLLGRAGGYRYQAALWRLLDTGRLEIHALTPSEIDRMAALMEQYRDTPMDLADASLVAVAESLSLRAVFTLDRDFYIYRLADGAALEVIP